MPASLDFTIHPAKTRWERDHNEALITPHGFELAIITIANGIAEYALAYRRRHGEPVGTRDPLGGLGLNDLLKGLLSLLAGDKGRLNVHRIEKVVHRFAVRHKLNFGDRP